MSLDLFDTEGNLTAGGFCQEDFRGKRRGRRLANEELKRVEARRGVEPLRRRL